MVAPWWCVMSIPGCPSPGPKRPPELAYGAPPKAFSSACSTSLVALLDLGLGLGDRSAAPAACSAAPARSAAAPAGRFCWASRVRCRPAPCAAVPGGPTARPRERAAERGGRARRAAPRRSLAPCRPCRRDARQRRGCAGAVAARAGAGAGAGSSPSRSPRTRRRRPPRRSRRRPSWPARRPSTPADASALPAGARSQTRAAACAACSTSRALAGVPASATGRAARRPSWRRAATVARHAGHAARCRSSRVRRRPGDLPAERQRAQRAGDAGAALARARGLELAGEPAVAAVGELAGPARADPEAGRDVVEAEAERPQQHGGALALGQVGQRLLHRPQRLAPGGDLLGRRIAAREPVVERRRRCAHRSQLAPVEPVPHDAGEVAGRVADRRRGPARELEPRLLVRLVRRLVEVVERLLAGPPRPRDEPPPRRSAQTARSPDAGRAAR